jgi:TetR/AcrR family transcriptional regulator
MKTPVSKPGRYVLRRARAEETKAAILRVAADRFATGGLAGARTEAIARAAGVNKALLYYYFKSKEGLYSAVLEEHLKDFSRRARLILTDAGSARQQVLRFVELHFDFISARPYYPVLFMHLMLSGGHLLQRLMRRYMFPVGDLLMRRIATGIRRGEFRRVDPGQMAVSLVGVNVFYFASAPIVRLLRRVEPLDPAQLRQRKRHVLDLVRFTLFQDPGDRNR